MMMMMLCSSLQPRTFLNSSFFYLQNRKTKDPHGKIKPFIVPKEISSIKRRRRGMIVCSALLPVDPWAPTIDSQSIASTLFAVSLFPYLGFLYFITKSNSAPKLTLFGFYFLLAFVGATTIYFGLTLLIIVELGLCFPGLYGSVPAGIYAKVHYGTSLSNVDWLHGGAESLLTLTNLFVVLGLRDALRKSKEAAKQSSSNASAAGIKEEKPSA